MVGWLVVRLLSNIMFSACTPQSRCVCTMYLVLFSWNAMLAEAGLCLQHLMYKDFCG